MTLSQFILGRGRHERLKRPNEICKRKMSGKDRKWETRKKRIVKIWEKSSGITVNTKEAGKMDPQH